MRKGSYSEELVWMSIAMLAHLSRKPAILLKSSVIQLRVVIAGAPMRTPPGESAEASPCGTSQHAQDVARFSHDEAGVAKLVEWWIGAWTHSSLLPVALCEILVVEILPLSLDSVLASFIKDSVSRHEGDRKGAHLSANDHLRLRSVVPSRTNCVVEDLREVSFRTAGC